MLNLAIEVAGFAALIIQGVEVDTARGAVTKAVGLVCSQPDPLLLHEIDM